MQGSLESRAVNAAHPSKSTQHRSNGRAPADPIHLRPAAAAAPRALLPGDPGRALALAQLLLEQPRMFNHHRGLWGYTGTASDGEPLMVQSTGMGGPSAAIVLHELIELGVRHAIRVGTCGALDPLLSLGDLIIAREAIAADGTSVALGADRRTRADPSLTDALAQAARAHLPASTAARCHDGLIVSTDLFYEPSTERNGSWHAERAVAVEMEASALFAVGEAAGVAVACALIVTDTFDASGARTRIDDDSLVSAVERMGRAAAGALGA